MNNLEQLNVRALSAKESKEVSGGFFGALLAGIFVGYLLAKAIFE